MIPQQLRSFLQSNFLLIFLLLVSVGISIFYYQETLFNLSKPLLQTLSSNCLPCDSQNASSMQLVQDIPEEEDCSKFKRTKIKCYQNSDFSEVCHYQCVCTVTNSSLGTRIFALSPIEEPLFQTNTNWDNLGMVPSGGYWFDETIKAPFKGYTIGVFVNDYQFRQFWATAKSNDAYINGTMWTGFWDDNGPNIFHFSEAAIPLGDWWLSGLRLSHIPRPTSYGLWHRTYMNDWQKNVFNLLTSPPPWDPIQDSPRNDADHVRNYQWFEQKETVCYDNLVFTGGRINLFDGQDQCDRYRRRVYQHLDIEGGWRKAPPHFVTIISRSHTRSFENIDYIESILRDFNLPYETVNFDSVSFEDQVRQMAKTGILIASAGADLTNVIHLPRFAVVIEVYPFHWHYQLYHNIARQCSLFHLHSLTTKDTGIQNVDSRCFNISLHDSMNSYDCETGFKNTKLYFDEREARRLIAEAAGLIRFHVPELYAQ